MKTKPFKYAVLPFFLSTLYCHNVYAERVTIPLISADELPAWCDQQLKTSKQKISAFSQTTFKDPTKILSEWDRTISYFDKFHSPLDFLSNVSPDATFRKNAEACLIKVDQFNTEIYQNPKIYQRIKASKPADQIDEKYKQDILDAFENNGIQLPITQQKRVKEIFDELAKTEQEFARNIRDNKQKLEFTPAELKGLPETYISALKKNEKGNYLLGFDYPEYIPFMKLADDDAARKRYQIAYTRRGTEQNLLLLKKAMDLRYELAQIFGYPSFSAWVLRQRMAKTPAEVDQFLSDVKAKVSDLEKREVQTLQAFKAKTLNIPLEQAKIERWNESYWSEKYKHAKFDIDQQELRHYFPTEAAKKWLFAISTELYGIEFKPVKVETWQSDVEYYDVTDKKTGQFIGGLYLDMFPREGKYSHAAVWSIYGSSTLSGQTPLSGLVTNFNRKGLDTDELETFVHEFGHALHGLLSNTRYSSQAGTSVERDFVEVPSQLYEEWARRYETLSKVADYCDPACPRVDEKLVQRLKQVHNYGRGLRYARQTLYSQFDMAIHNRQALKEQPLDVWEKMESATALGYVPTTQFPGQFNHVMGGYEAGYYGYMWSEVMVWDMLSAFGDHLLNPEVGQRYRATVLSQGSQKPAKQLVKDFLGRDADSSAFFKEIVGQNQ